MAVADYFDTVQKIYIAFYQRPADPAGLRYWADRVEVAGGNTAAVIDAFANSEEATELYGPINAETIGDVIGKIYQALFNRAPDPAGQAYYEEAFANGELTQGNIALAILNAAQNDDVIAINNKLDVANEFTAQVDGRELTDPAFGTGGKFNVTYQGDADAEAARDILSGVTANPDSVLSAADVTEALKSNIADEGDPIGNVSSGETVTLTTGADTFNGTSANDVINALSVNANGGTATTLSAFDKIDGGAGTDTLNIYTDVNSGFFGSKINAGFPDSASVKNVEIVNIYNAGNTAAAFGDASKFEGVEQLWQVGRATNVTSLGEDTTAGFRNLTTNALSVEAAKAATSAQVALDAVKGNSANVVTLNVAGAALTTVTVTGEIAQQNTTTGAADASLALNVAAGKDVQAVTVDTALNTTLNVTNEAGSSKAVNTIDASASTGDITITAAKNVAITTGSGNDTIIFEGVPALNSKIDGGEGTDTVQVGGTAFATQQYDALNQLSNIEILAFSGAAKIDAAQLADFKAFEFQISGSTVDNLAADQTVTALADGDFTLNNAAETVNLVLGTDGADTNLLVTFGTGKANGGTLNVSGDGDLTFTNGAAEGSRAFATIDLSELAGDSTLIGAAAQETFVLGAGNTTLTVTSTLGAIDTIEGFDSVIGEGDDAVDLLKFGTGDNDFIVGNVTNIQLEAGISLNEAFQAAAVASHEATDAFVAFQFEGNTYVFQDIGAGNDGVYDNTDFALKIIGLHDLSDANGAYAAA